MDEFEGWGAAVAAGVADGVAQNADHVSAAFAPIGEDVREIFEGVGGAIAEELDRAANTGELSFKRMGLAIAAALAEIALDQLILGPLGDALGKLGRDGASAPVFDLVGGAFGGARAEGGLASPGLSYLVGERGPELFTPHETGRIAPASASQPSVVMHVHGATEPAAWRRSEAQILANLQRAVARSQRSL